MMLRVVMSSNIKYSSPIYVYVCVCVWQNGAGDIRADISLLLIMPSPLE